MGDSDDNRLARKIKENPFMPIGFVGFVGALAYGAYKYKHRGDMSRSLFFVQLRVGAQSMVVGTLCLGVMLSVGKRIFYPSEPKEH